MTSWFDEAFRSAYLTLYQHRSDEQAKADVEWLLSEVQPRAGLKVLDLCCGNGRHSAQIAQRDVTVVGLDRSMDLLDVAARRGEANVSWVRGDMRRLPLAGVFDLVVNLFTSFGYFESDQDDRLVLSEIDRVLSPGGVAVLDIMNASRVRATLVPESHTERKGWKIHERRRLTEGKARVEKEVTLIDSHGRVTEWKESVRLHDQGSIEALTERTSLNVDAVFGSMAGGAFDENSERMVVFLKKRAS